MLDELDLDMDGGRVPRPDGAVGLGQDDAAEPDRRPRPARRGPIVVGGEDLDAPRRGSELAQWRAENVGFVFQGFNLLPVLTALENVELPLLLTPLSRRERREQASARSSWSASPTACTTSRSELSGGQEQRVAIARAIATDPQLILRRRADRRPRPRDRRPGPRPAAAAQRGARQDDRDGHARPAGREHATRTIVHLDKGKLGRSRTTARRAAGEALMPWRLLVAQPARPPAAVDR